MSDAGRRRRLASNYRRILSPRYRERWSLENPGNFLAHRERQDWFAAQLSGDDLPASAVVLDVGCGGMSALPVFDHCYRVGVDLLMERLANIDADAGTSLLNADAARLPVADASVDVVTMMTLISSVSEPSVRQAIGREIDRVLRPGGIVLWYDMRLPNPFNPAVARVSRRELRRLFAGCSLTVSSITVLPPLSRRLVAWRPATYRWLTRIPALRSHLIAVARKG